MLSALGVHPPSVLILVQLRTVAPSVHLSKEGSSPARRRIAPGRSHSWSHSWRGVTKPVSDPHSPRPSPCSEEPHWSVSGSWLQKEVKNPYPVTAMWTQPGPTPGSATPSSLLSLFCHTS
jgi:hypothetical protein